MKSRPGKSYYLVTIIIGVTLSLIFGYYHAVTSMKGKRAQIAYASDVYAARLETVLDGLFHKTDILESVIIAENGKMDRKTFDNLAKSLVNNNHGIRAIQYQPNGIVEFCYPVAGNEKSIGGSVFKNLKGGEDAVFTMNSKRLTLSGPYQLTQGGVGLVARNPVFLSEAEGDDHFIGFTVLVMDLPAALDPLLFKSFENDGYLYRLSTVVEGKNVDIAQSENYRSNEPVVSYISVPNHLWTLEICPKNNWYDTEGILWRVSIGLLLTFMAVMLVYTLEKSNQRLTEFSETDELTSLVNRRKLLSFMEQRTLNKKRPFAMLYMDLNGFKQINDELGHDQGDFVLKTAAARIKSIAHEGDVVARMGGDEFIFVVEGCDKPEDCQKRIDQLNQRLAEKIVLRGAEVSMTSGIGYAFFPAEADNVHDLIHIADERMYKNKKTR